MSGTDPIRSYQRIFRPERRIYHVEGRALPVPGGIPLRWLVYATAALLAVVVIGSGSITVAVAGAAVAAISGLFVGGRLGALTAGVVALAAIEITGIALGLLDWPIRLFVIPAAVATIATQATPDGRRADRFAASWLALRIAPSRRSLGRDLPLPGRARVTTASMWTAPDERAPALRRARVRGRGTIAFAREIRVQRVGPRQRRLVARSTDRLGRRGSLTTSRLALGDGEVLEVRP